MAARQGLLELKLGGRVRLNGIEWMIEAIEPHTGRIWLEATDGRVEQRSIRWLIHHPDARAVNVAKAKVASIGSGHPRSSGDLTDDQLKRAKIRAEHVLEAETGFRSGHPELAGPGEPRSAYDPDLTTVTQRRCAKVAELKGMPPHEAAMLGLQYMSERTLERLSAHGPDGLVLACADGRWTRRCDGHRTITEEIREAIFAVRRECLGRSKISMAARHRLLHQYMTEQFPSFPRQKVPSLSTFRRVWLEWFGSGGARARYERSAAMAEEAGVGRRLVVHRPGQVVALDSTPLPVKLRETVFGEPVSSTLTLALDLYTHGAPAFRLTLDSDTSVDVAMLLRDVMLPLPMRDGWGEDMAWPYPGVPAEILTEFAGHKVAALPFFAPETVTTDHGSVYKNHEVVDAQRELGINIVPARTYRASDKFALERAFGAFNTMLFEHLLGYTGVDVSDRGADPEADAVLTRAQMEHVIATWIVKVWQNHILGEYAPSWGPGEQHSPNSLFAAAMQQGGWAMQIPEPDLYYRVLRKHYVAIHRRRGVKILGLWYHDDVVEEDRFRRRSQRGGKHAGKWLIRSDRRDRRRVFFQDPDDAGIWHTLRWTGLPPEGEVPAFSDKTAADLLSVVRERRLAPRTDAELLPVLLELLGEFAPVEQWPTQKRMRKRATKRDRVSRSREMSRAEMSDEDREGITSGQELGSWREHVQTVQQVVDNERRQRREAALGAGPVAPVAPQLLDDVLESKQLFLTPYVVDDEEDEHLQEDA